MIKGILFDFDGVLVPIDDTIRQAIREAIVNKCLTLSAITCQQAENQLKNILAKSDYDEIYLKLLDAALKMGSHGREDINSLFHSASDERQPKLQKQIATLLQDLYQRGIIIGIVSLSSRQRIEQTLMKIGARQYFSFIESASSQFLKAVQSEWKTVAYQKFLVTYGFSSKEVLCVGDSQLIDLQPAHALGIETALITHHYNNGLREKSCADYILPRHDFYKLLPKILDNNCNSCINRIASSSRCVH
jgi:phosphoglycolate phosphatase-like HAD superfamily hydrolase